MTVLSNYLNYEMTKETLSKPTHKKELCFPFIIVPKISAFEAINFL